HLAIAVDLDDELHAFFQRGAIAGDHGTAHTEVGGVAQHHHTGVRAVLFDEVAAAFRTGVVHCIDALAFGADACDDVEHVLCDLVAGTHHSDFGRSAVDGGHEVQFSFCRCFSRQGGECSGAKANSAIPR